MSPDQPTGYDVGGENVDVRDLLGAYALDAVDDVERRAVERLAASDPDVASELAGLTATAALLGSAVSATPPAELRAAVLSQITGTAQVGPVPGRSSSPMSSSERRPGAARTAGVPRRTVWLAVAATALVAASVPSTLAWQQIQQTQRVEQQVQATADLLADPDAQVVRADVAGGGTAVGVLAGDRALITATGLHDPGAGKTYQLWVLRDGVPLPDAVMPESSGRARAFTDDFVSGDSLAVTIEPDGGSKEPTTDPVVVLAPA